MLIAGQHNQQALERAGKILGLAMAIGVIVVGGYCRQREHGQCHQGAGKIDNRLEGIGKKTDRSGQPPGQAL